MIRILRILFDGKKTVDVREAVNQGSVEPRKKEIVKQLNEIDKSYHKIDQEAQKMKRRIDTALAIAMSTGGLR